jgi:hypothetical protein
MEDAPMLIRRFLKDQSGNFAMTFGLTILPIMFVAGLALDYSAIQRERWRMQETADSAALYAAKELEKAGVEEADLVTTGREVIDANFMIDGDLGYDMDTQANAIRVTLAKVYDPTFLALMDPGPINLGVLAEVRYEQINKGAKCFMALSETGTGMLNLNGNALINAKNCDVHVNSDSVKAVDLNGNGTSIKAASNCFHGNVESGYERIQPPPVTGDACPVLPDPFDSVVTPTVGPCDYTDYKVHSNKTVTLSPGVYCGGLDVSSGAKVTFSPGLYIIKDGGFKTTGSVNMTGIGVTFYFVGDDVELDFSGGTTFHFVAMTKDQANNDQDQLAGFVVFFDVDADYSETNAFSGNSNTYFEGILYFGRREVKINGEGEVNSGSPLSVLVANNIVLDGNATINFNIDPANTDLTIPQQLYQKTITVYLTR